ncbi:unnamed protein product [Trichobilharzia szidati]|nr:unnamed protein product [Trichobilharzia szidati]
MNVTSEKSDTDLTLYSENNIEIYSTLFVQTTVCIIGAILNILNVIVLSRRQFEATPYLFMTALSLTDTGILLVHLPSGMVRCGQHFQICQSEGYKQFRVILLYYTTYIGFGLGNILEASSVWITVLISAERYIIMKWQHLGKLFFTRRQGKWQILFTVCLAVVFNSPFFFTLTINYSVKPGPNNTTKRLHYGKLTWFGESQYYLIFTWLRFIFVQCIPLITLCIANVMLLRLTWSSYHNQMRHQLRQQSYMQHSSQTVFAAIKAKVVNTDKSINKQSKSVTQVTPDPQTLLSVNDDEKEGCNTQEESEKFDNRLQTNNNNNTEDDCCDKQKDITDNNNNSNSIPIKRTSLASRRLERSQQANNKLSILLMTVIFLFIIGQIPQALAYVHILNLIVPRSCVNCRTFSSLYKHFSQLLCLITSTTNFFLYVTLNRNFRECLKGLCRLRCKS